MPSSQNENKYAPKAWQSRDFDFKLPSGDICLLRRMDPIDLIEHGLQDKLDFATTVVMNEHVKNASKSNVERVKEDRARRAAKAKGEDPDAAVEAMRKADALEEMSKDPQKLVNFRIILDQVLTLFVVAPKMHLPPENEEDRVKGQFYTDSVPFNDKVAIFNELMKGVKTVETFREGSEEAVGDVASEPSVRPAAKPRARASRKGSSS